MVAFHTHPQAAGCTHLWLPPPSQSVSAQGYLPGQLYNLDHSKYGNKEQLKVGQPGECGWTAVARPRGEGGTAECLSPLHFNARDKYRHLYVQNPVQTINIMKIHMQLLVFCPVSLQELIAGIKGMGMVPIADIVINHRCNPGASSGFEASVSWSIYCSMLLVSISRCVIAFICCTAQQR